MGIASAKDTNKTRIYNINTIYLANKDYICTQTAVVNILISH